MATYLRPGVFVEETLQTLTNSSLSDSTDAIPTFVGTSTKGGPTTPTLITSWSQFVALYGDIKGATSDLPFAVYSFFNNGGSQCYVLRATLSGASAASQTFNDPAAGGSDTAEPALTVTAASPGTWGNNIFVSISTSTDTGHRFDLTIEVGQGSSLVAREHWSDLTLDPADGRYALSVVNSPTVGSKYVRLTDPGVFGNDADAGKHDNPATVTAVPLVGGSDGSGSPDYPTTLTLLDDIENVLLVNLPGVSDTTILTSAITWASAAGDRFILADAPKPAATDTAADVTADSTTMAGSLPPSSYVAVYSPWVWTQDPSSTVPGALRLTAPSGLVMGQYVRNDVLRGVQKAPAGVNTALRVNAAFCRFTDLQLESMNQAGVNVVRNVPGAGFCIMGARTLNTGMPDRYINIRRTLIYLKRNLINLTQFAVFEPNDSNTWDTVSAVLTQFLTTFWQNGGLAGNTTDQAFYVICDSTINTPASVNAGVLNVQVGVALETPAEFIVIALGQFDGGATVTDTTEEG